MSDSDCSNCTDYLREHCPFYDDHYNCYLYQCKRLYDSLNNEEIQKLEELTETFRLKQLHDSDYDFCNILFELENACEMLSNKETVLELLSHTP
jgi:hypothetical protein